MTKQERELKSAKRIIAILIEELEKHVRETEHEDNTALSLARKYLTGTANI